MALFIVSCTRSIAPHTNKTEADTSWRSFLERKMHFENDLTIMHPNSEKENRNFFMIQITRQTNVKSVVVSPWSLKM